MSIKDKNKNQTEWGYQTNPLNDLTPTNHRRKKNWLPFIGGFLILAGLVFFAATSGIIAAKWVMGLWPLFALIAGVAAVMGFAVERKPRSPLSGMLLIFIGVLFLAGRVQPDLNPLQIYGRYWIVLLAIFAIIELIRHYSHRQSDGKPPKLFTLGKVLMLSLIVGTGVFANQASNNPQVLGALHLPKFLSELRDSVLGDKYAFTDEDLPIASIPPSSKVIVNNGYGDVKIVGVSTQPKARLVKEVRAWNRDEAQKIADQIQIKVDKNADGSFSITTNRDQVQGQFQTDIELELPASANISIANSYGSISAQNIKNGLAVKSSIGNIEASNIAGPVELTLKNSDQVLATGITGDVTIKGAKNVRLNDITGNVKLNGQRGSLELNRITGELNVESPFSNINVQNVAEGTTLKTEHGNIKLSDTGSADIDAPHSDVTALKINGDITIRSVHSTIKTSTISGILIVDAEHADIIGDELRGTVDIETSYGEVSVKNFHEAISIKTSFKEVKLAPAADFDGDISVENSRGNINLQLPQAASYHLDAESRGGRVKTIGFSDSPATKERDHVVYSAGMGGGPEIKLRTSFNNITITANGSRQAKSDTPVKAPAN